MHVCWTMPKPSFSKIFLLMSSMLQADGVAQPMMEFWTLARPQVQKREGSGSGDLQTLP